MASSQRSSGLHRRHHHLPRTGWTRKRSLPPQKGHGPHHSPPWVEAVLRRGVSPPIRAMMSTGEPPQDRDHCKTSPESPQFKIMAWLSSGVQIPRIHHNSILNPQNSILGILGSFSWGWEPDSPTHREADEGGCFRDCEQARGFTSKVGDGVRPGPVLSIGRLRMKPCATRSSRAGRKASIRL